MERNSTALTYEAYIRHDLKKRATANFSMIVTAPETPKMVCRTTRGSWGVRLNWLMQIVAVTNRKSKAASPSSLWKRRSCDDGRFISRMRPFTCDMVKAWRMAIKSTKVTRMLFNVKISIL